MKKYTVFVKDELLNRATSRNIWANTEKAAIVEALALQYGKEMAVLFNGFRLNRGLDHFEKLGVHISATA